MAGRKDDYDDDDELLDDEYEEDYIDVDDDLDDDDQDDADDLLTRRASPSPFSSQRTPTSGGTGSLPGASRFGAGSNPPPAGGASRLPGSTGSGSPPPASRPFGGSGSGAPGTGAGANTPAPSRFGGGSGAPGGGSGSSGSGSGSNPPSRFGGGSGAPGGGSGSGAGGSGSNPPNRVGGGSGSPGGGSGGAPPASRPFGGGTGAPGGGSGSGAGGSGSNPPNRVGGGSGSPGGGSGGAPPASRPFGGGSGAPGGGSGSGAGGSGSNPPSRFGGGSGSPGGGSGSSGSGSGGSGSNPPSRFGGGSGSPGGGSGSSGSGSGGSGSNPPGRFGGGSEKRDDKPPDRKDNRNDDKPAGGLGGLGGKVGGALGGLGSRFGGGGSEKKDDKPGAKNDDKKDSKPSGGGLAGLGSRFGGGNAEKKDDKPAGGGLAGLGSRFGGGNKSDEKKPAAGAPQSSSSGGFGGLGGARPGSAPPPGGARPAGTGSGFDKLAGAAPAKGSGSRASAESTGLGGRLRGMLPFGKKEGGGSTAGRRGSTVAGAKGGTKTSKTPRITGESWLENLDNRLDLVGVLLLLGSLALFFSTLSTTKGQLTEAVNTFLAQTFGWGSLAVPVAMFAVGMWLVLRHFGDEPPVLDPTRIIGVVVLYIGILVMFQFMESFNYTATNNRPVNSLEELELQLNLSWQIFRTGGGWIGAQLYYLLVSNITEFGAFFALVGWLVVGIMLSLRLTVSELAIITISSWRGFTDARKRAEAKRAARLADRIAAAALAMPKVTVTAPELPNAAPSPALPAPAAASAVQAALPAPAVATAPPPELERSIPITMGGRTVNASLNPVAEPAPLVGRVPASPVPGAPPVRSPLSPAPASAAPAAGLQPPPVRPIGDEKPEESAKAGGLFGKLRGAVANPGALGQAASGALSALTPDKDKPLAFPAEGESKTAAPTGIGRFFGGRGQQPRPDEAKPAADAALAGTLPVAATASAVPAAAPATPADSSRFAPPNRGTDEARLGDLARSGSPSEPPSRFGRPGGAGVPSSGAPASTSPSGGSSLPVRDPAVPAAGGPPPARAPLGTDRPNPAAPPAPFGARPAASAAGSPAPGSTLSPTERPAASTPGGIGTGAPPARSPFGADRPAAGSPPLRSPGLEKPVLDDEDDDFDLDSLDGDDDELDTNVIRPSAAASSLPARDQTTGRVPVSPFGARPAASTPGTAEPSPAERSARLDAIRSGQSAMSAASMPAAEKKDDAPPDRPAAPMGTLRTPPPPAARVFGAGIAGAARPPLGKFDDDDDELDDELDMDDEIELEDDPDAIIEDDEDAIDLLDDDELDDEDDKPVSPVRPAASPFGGVRSSAPPMRPVPGAVTSTSVSRPASTDDDKDKPPFEGGTLRTPLRPAASSPTPAPSPFGQRPAQPAPAASSTPSPIPAAAQRAPSAPAPTPAAPAPVRPQPTPAETQQPAAISAPISRGPAPAKPRKEWKVPDYTTLLSSGSEQDFDREFLLERARVIEDTLQSFGAPGKVVEVNTGPVITQFGVEPDYLLGRNGKKTRVKVSAIAALDKDMQLALGAKSIRVEAPVPGKGFVGVEVPNATSAVVSLRDVMESEDFLSIDSPLAICLGQSVDGTPISADLTSMPHLLVAGTTGSGKSVCVNAIIASILLRNSPDKVKFIMVDPKRVELTGYNGIPHLVAPVVVELERIVGVLKWVTREMDERYKKFAELGARNIEDYNKHLMGDEPRLPYIVVIIDELADLMMMAPDETEKVITRIAALARATGIHLVIATQRPSVDIITGLIKANFPARIAFAVAGGVDSRVILDQPGAERLLGRGDMLYMSGDSPAPLRLQGVYVSDTEINNITRYWKTFREEDTTTTARPAPTMVLDDSPGPKETRPVLSRADKIQQQAFWDRGDTSSSQPTSGSGGERSNLNPEEDDLYDEAVDMIRRLDKASVSLLQRRLRIGYTRAARLIDLMEERGVVGPAQEGSKPREVLPLKKQP